jgi:hypothetical protein
MENKFEVINAIPSQKPYIGIPVMEVIKNGNDVVLILEKHLKDITECKNYVVLAAWQKPWGMEFVRWYYNETRNDFYWGHYFGNSYEDALKDYQETIAK